MTEKIETPTALKTLKPKLSIKNGIIDLNHGAGGRAMTELIEKIFIPAFNNPILATRSDQAIINNLPGNRLAFATDSYVVSPLFFNGGDIGSLAVHGTINDIACSGATPYYLAASFILAEGFPLKDLQRIVRSMATAADSANVSIVTGDTKVVERGACDGVFINTSGIGVLSESFTPKAPQPDDLIIINGDIGDHGTAIISQRENLSFITDIPSDTAPLHELIKTMISAVPTIRCLRDPTRGGVAAVLNEWAQYYGLGFLLEESTLPIKTSVRSACELMGQDPLHLANEGKVLALCPPAAANTLLDQMQQHPLGQNAAIIGKVVTDPHCFVQMNTLMGGTRLVDWLAGEQLPRIC